MLSGCVSATPRAYSPVMQPPPADRAKFEREFADCSSAVAAGRRSFGQSGSAIAVGGVGGVAAVPVVGAAASAASLGGAFPTAMAASGVALVMLVPLMTYSLSSARRTRNEQEIQGAMTACLAQNGQTVSAWSRVTPRDAASMTTLTPTRPAHTPR